MAKIVTPVHDAAGRSRRSLYGAAGLLQVTLLAVVSLTFSQGLLLSVALFLVAAASVLGAVVLWSNAAGLFSQAEGERFIAATLAQILPPDWYLLNDLIIQGLPGEGGRLHHVVIAPPGVFVLHTCILAGKMSAEGDYWVVRSPRGRVARVESPALRTAALVRAVTDELVRLQSVVSVDPSWLDRVPVRAAVVLAHRGAVYVGPSPQAADRADPLPVVTVGGISEYFLQHMVPNAQTPDETHRLSSQFARLRA